MSLSIKNLKRSKIRDTFYCEGEPVYIYNPTPKQKRELVSLAMKYLNINNKEIEIDNDEITIKLLKELTSLKDIIPEDKEEIKAILDDPSDLLVNVKNSLEEIVTEIVVQSLNSAKNIIELYKKLGLSDKTIKEITNSLNSKTTKKLGKKKDE